MDEINNKEDIWNTPFSQVQFACLKRAYLIVRLQGFQNDDLLHSSQVEKIQEALDLENVRSNGMYFWTKLDVNNQVKLFNLIDTDTKFALLERLSYVPVEVRYWWDINKINK